MQRITLMKLFADFIFCSIDVFELGGRISDGWQISAGLVAAILGTFKLYLKNK